jgi:hypothetical protein
MVQLSCKTYPSGATALGFVTGAERVAPATSLALAEGSGGGCNAELGFCGMSGKSGGKIGGLTAGEYDGELSASGSAMASVLKT